MHGNRQALDAVLRAARATTVAEWWFLGDAVGYGADPVYCARYCLSSTARRVAGNHDLAAAGRVDWSTFVDWAQEAMAWTITALGPGLIAELGRLEAGDTDHEVALVHGSPRDPVWEYVTSSESARGALEATGADLTFCGHTHVPTAWRIDASGRVDGGQIVGERTLELGDGRWLINPGSVGQPRDGDARAAWALYDPDAGTVSFRRTPYDVAAAQNAILAAGLPDSLANRLSIGR